MVPELEELVAAGEASGDAAKATAAQALRTKLEEVLTSENHRWYLDLMTPEERAERKQRQDEFQRRYEK
jgi:hypothetical protein